MNEAEESVQVRGADAASRAAGTDAASSDLDATWLSNSLLLAVGAADLHLEGGQGTVTVFAGDDSFAAQVRCMSLVPDGGSGTLNVLTVAVGEGPSDARSTDRLRLSSAGGDSESGTTTVALTDFGSIVSDRLSGLHPAVARRVLSFISAAPSAHGMTETEDPVLSNSLHFIWKALRQPLPPMVLDGNQPLCGNIDLLVPVDDQTFFAKGWLRDGESRVARLTAVTPEGDRAELLHQLFRLELPQFEMFADGPYSQPIDAAGFIVRFQTPRPSRLRRAWVFELQNETGRAVEMYVMPDVADVASARERILLSTPADALPDESLMSRHVFPAIDRLQERAREHVEVGDVIDYGEVNPSPSVSIIIPLYKRIDLVEHQLLHFDRDPEIRAEELIYVLDSPELKREFADRARQLAKLYRVPFRVVTMARNVGFGVATNVGASVARGRLLLLLNSDVLPVAPGWLGKMREFYDSTPDIAALGAKLLYEDDSLQHAGLYFQKVDQGPTAGSWANMHYFKGLHKDLPAAVMARAVPAVTAACLLVDRELYFRVGGLPDVYVQGDYEDSELCLRLLEEGRENWYLPAAELYHLEGASYEEAERGITGSYNRWLQTKRCGRAIEAALDRYHVR